MKIHNATMSCLMIFFNFVRENKIKTEDKNITLKKENVNRELNSRKDGVREVNGKKYTQFQHLVI